MVLQPTLVIAATFIFQKVSPLVDNFLRCYFSRGENTLLRKEEDIAIIEK
jgi:hypothetical protein